MDPAPVPFHFGSVWGEKNSSWFDRKWRNPKMGLWVLFWAERAAAEHVAICAAVMIEGMFV